MHYTYQYAIDWNKVKTLDDMKLIFEAVQITFGPDNKHLEGIMHLVTKVEVPNNSWCTTTNDTVPIETK